MPHAAGVHGQHLEIAAVGRGVDEADLVSERRAVKGEVHDRARAGLIRHASRRDAVGREVARADELGEMMHDDGAAALHAVEALALASRGDANVVTGERIGDRLALEPLLARPFAEGEALPHDEKGRGALEKRVALREGREAQPQRGAGRAPFPQPMLQYRERRARRRFLARRAKLARLDREVALLGGKQALRGLQPLHEDRAGDAFRAALLPERPDELGAAAHDALLRVTRQIATPRKR